MKQLNFMLKWLLGVGFALGSFMAVRGAVYNLYFNNTEQGDNGTATPTVQVHGQAAAESTQKEDPVKAEEAVAKTEEAPQEEVSAEDSTPQLAEKTPPPSSGATTNAQPGSNWWGRNVESLFPDRKMFRFTLGGQYYEEKWKDYDWYHDENGNTQESWNSNYTQSGGATANLGFFPLSYLGFNVFASLVDGGSEDWWLGGELELIPISFKIFGFGNQSYGSRSIARRNQRCSRE